MHQARVGMSRGDILSSQERRMPEVNPIEECLARAGAVDAYQSFARGEFFTIRFGEETCFNHDASQVIIGRQQLARLGITSPREVDFAVLHELGHLKEFTEDPKGYLALVQRTLSEPQGRHIFTLYNCLMDIYVNHNNANCAPVYRQWNGEFTDEVKSMYRDMLFAKRDLTGEPLSYQFAYYLLNLGMGVADDIRVSSEVRKVLDAGVVDAGYPASFKDVIEGYLLPVVGAPGPDEWRGTISDRTEVIERLITPSFRTLLQEDLRRGASFKSSDAVSAGIPLEDMKGFIDQVISKKAERDATPMERSRSESEKQCRELAQEAGVSEDVAKDFLEVQRRTRKLSLDLAELWRRFREPVVEERLTKGPVFYTTGANLSIRQSIIRYATVENNPEEAAVMERYHYEPRLSLVPRTLRIRLLPDLSKSMEEDIDKVKDIVVAVGVSLMMAHGDSKEEGIPLDVEFQVVGFQGAHITILPLTPNPSIKDLMRGFPRVVAGGGTADHTALEEVRRSVIGEPRAAETEQPIDVMIEITDGATTDPQRSRRLLEEIMRSGVRAAAIKFTDWGPFVAEDNDAAAAGGPRTPSTGSPLRLDDPFYQVWIQGHPKPLGQYISSSSGLTNALFELLGDLIRDPQS